MQALFVAWYNFGRKHEALKGNHVWTIKELIERAGEVGDAKTLYEAAIHKRVACRNGNMPPCLLSRSFRQPPK
jgi:hypothetical protein